MGGRLSIWSRLRVTLVDGLAVLALIGASGVAPADELAPLPAEKQAAKATEPMSLLACRQLALERAPALTAAKASLNAALAREHAVNHMGLAGLISRDLSVRRQQAALGVSIHAAGLTQTEWDTIHSVTFSYLSAVYARRQLLVADEAIERLKYLSDITAEILKPEKRKDVSKRNLDTINVYLLVAEGRREDALTGQERALSALREAMGLDADCPLAVDFAAFKTADPPAKDAIVAAALARRGEITQAANASVVTCLEISAQKKIHGLRANTFAAASDIHAREVPQGSHDESYRPGAIGLEMPVLLPGHKSDRVSQAQAYYDRTEALVDKTHKLITLEAEQAYLRWQENSRKGVKLREAAAAANALSKETRDKFNPQVEGRIGLLDEVVNAGVTGANTQLLANEVDYKRQLALAELERVTAGGFEPGWEQVPAKTADARLHKKKK